MTEKKYNIVKAVSWYTIGNILIKGVAFFVLPVFTHLMSTHEYGIYSVYSSYLSIFEVIILLGLSATIAIARYAKTVEFDSYISTAISLPVLLVLICAIVVNTFLLFEETFLSMDAVLWNCLFISAAGGAVSNIIGARLVLEGKYRIYMGYSALYTFGNVGLSVLLCYTIFHSHDIHLARVYGNTLAVIISTFFLLITTKTRFYIRKIYLKYALAWGIPLLFHTLATVILTQSDRILIRYLESYSSAGIYATATTVVTIIMVLQSSFLQAWQPWFYGKLDKKDYKSICWLNDRYIVLFGAVVVGFMLISPEVIHLFTDKNYWGSIYCLLPLSISVFGEMLYSLPTSVEYYNNKTTYIVVGTLITGAINIFLDIIFIMWFGYVGAAYATAISKLILFLMHSFFAKKVDKNAVFSYKVVVVVLVILTAANCLCVATVNRLTFVRFILVAVIGMGAGWYLWNHKKILFLKLRG